LEEIEPAAPESSSPDSRPTPGIGFVVVDSLAEGPVAIGAGPGVHVLRSGRVEGEDPLTAYGRVWPPASLLRQAEMPQQRRTFVRGSAGWDDYKPTRWRPFEETGRMSRWASAAGRPTRSWCTRVGGFSAKPPVGSDAVHEVLIDWLEKPGGNRKDLKEPVESKVEA